MPNTGKPKNSNQNRAENLMSDPTVNCTKQKRTIFSSKFHNNVKSHIKFDEGVANIIYLQNPKSLPHRPQVNSQRVDPNQNTSSMLASGEIFHYPPGVSVEQEFYHVGSSKKKNLLIRNHSAIQRDLSDLADKKFKTSDTGIGIYQGSGALFKSSNDPRLIHSAVMSSRISASEAAVHRLPKQSAEKRAPNRIKKNDTFNTIFSLKDSQVIITK